MPVNKNQSTKIVKLDLSDLNLAERIIAKQEAGEIIVEEIQRHLDQSKSPVKNGKFKLRKADGQRSELFEFGDMRAQITFEELEGDEIEVGIFDTAPEVERLKSFNHNVGDTVPQRRFVPSPNQVFKASIMKRVNDNTESIREESQEQEVEDGPIESQSLGDIFSDSSIESLIREILSGES